MAAKKISIAITGSTSPKGKALKEALPSSRLQSGQVKFLDDIDLAGTLTEYDNGAEMIAGLTLEAVNSADLVFLCGDAEQTEECLRGLGKEGAVAIVLGCVPGSTGNRLPTTALLPRGRQPTSTLALPDSLAIGLATVLDACFQAGELEYALSTNIVPVSELGNAGSEALHRQTVELLNFSAVPEDLFGRQLIFNIHPAFAQPTPAPPGGGCSVYEKAVEAQVRHLISRPELPLLARAALAPIFFSTIISLFVKFEDDPSEESLRSALTRYRSPSEEGPLFQLFDEADDPADIPSPLDSSQSRLFQVGRLQAVSGVTGAFWMWISYDNILRGGVLDAIALAEELLPD